MTLLALLTDRLAPGVWHIDPNVADPAAIEELADGLGWDVRHFSPDDDKAATIRDVCDAAGAPGYVRSNWDSLEDGLRDIARPRNDRLLLIADSSTATAFDDVVIDILDNTARFWDRYGIRIVVVWVGPGSGPRLDAVAPVRASRRG